MATPSLPRPLFRRPADRQAPGRQAFPFAVAVELAVLNDYYQTDVYPKRECVWLRLCLNYAALVANSAKDGVQRLNAANVCAGAILGSLMIGGGGSTSSNGVSNGNGNGNGNGNNGNGNGNGNGASVSQVMPNTNGVTYTVPASPTGNCGAPSAGGTVVSRVLTASRAA